MHSPPAHESFSIREATEADLPALVLLHVTSWNATYPHYHPKPSPELRERQWKDAFREKEDNWCCYVVENNRGEIAGFATGNDFHDNELGYEAQLNKIHFYQQYQRRGLGRLLVGHIVRRFLDRGFHSMILFADPQNPNIAFYDKLGGERILDSNGTFHGAYGWKDLQKLAVLCAV